MHITTVTLTTTIHFTTTTQRSQLISLSSTEPGKTIIPSSIMTTNTRELLPPAPTVPVATTVDYHKSQIKWDHCASVTWSSNCSNIHCHIFRLFCYSGRASTTLRLLPWQKFNDPDMPN